MSKLNYGGEVQDMAGGAIRSGEELSLSFFDIIVHIMADTAFQHQPKLQGILTALPSSLPFHPYNDNHPSHRRQNPHNKYRHRRRRAEEEVYHHNDPEGATADDYIEDAPIYPSNSEEDSFTLFLFVDGTNRHGVSLPFLSLANGFSMR